MDGNPIGYTTWENVRGDCGHIHSTLEEDIECLDRDLYWVGSMGDGMCTDRWLYSLELYPGGEIMRQPLSSEDKAMLPRIRF